jgi:hypothetical protein
MSSDVSVDRGDLHRPLTVVRQVHKLKKENHMFKALFDLAVITASFLAGAKYGRNAEQNIVATIVKDYDGSAAKAIAYLSSIRARIVSKL